MIRECIAEALWLEAWREVAQESGIELGDDEDRPSAPKAAERMAEDALAMARQRGCAVAEVLHLVSGHSVLTYLAAESMGALYSEQLGCWVSEAAIERAIEREYDRLEGSREDRWEGMCDE